MPDWGRLLEEDLEWREGELASLKVQVALSPPESVVRRSLLRSISAMLYAHYEGFCKFAWDLYLDAVQESASARTSLTSEIASFSLAKAFKELRGDTSYPSLYSFCSSAFPTLMVEKAEFVVRLETNSNLWPDLLRRNSESVGLPHDKVDEYEVALRALVSRRNEIAHGKKMFIETLEEYSKYEDAVFLVMHELALAVVDSLDNHSYLRETRA